MHLKLRYDRSGLGGLIAFKSSGTTELTLKEGMAYLRRTLDGEAPAYRVMPASNFLSGILEQLVFMLNLSDLIAGSIPTDPITMTGGGQSEGDYGVILSDILSSYGYQKEEAGSRWTLNLNGPVLTGDVLDNIAVTLRSANYNGTDNVLRTLDVTTKLVDIIGVTANLTFRNPCGVWEAGASDETADVSLDFGASAEMFAAYDWASQAVNAYLEPQRSTVRYTVDGEQAGEQEVWYAGDRLFTALSYPDLSGYEAREGYTLRWKEFAFAPGGTAEAVYMPNLYDVTFVSTVSPGDGWTENDDGTYSFATQMYYGAEVSVTYYGETIVYTMRADGVLQIFDVAEARADGQEPARLEDAAERPALQEIIGAGMEGAEGPERVFDHERVQRVDVVAHGDRPAAHRAQVLLPLHARALREPGHDRAERRDDRQDDRPPHPLERLFRQIVVSPIDVQRVEGAVLFIHIGRELPLLFQQSLPRAQLFCHTLLPCCHSFLLHYTTAAEIMQPPRAPAAKKSQGVHLVEGEQEGGDEMLHKIAQAGQVARAQVRLDGLLRLFELGVAALELFEALDVGGELVRRLDQLVFVGGGVRLDAGGEGGREFGGEHGEQLFAGEILQLAVRAADLAVEVLDGGGEVARHHLRALVVQRPEHRLLDVGRVAEDLGVDDGERVGEHRHLLGVLHDVFVARRAHERPAADVLHAVQKGKKVIHIRFLKQSCLYCSIKSVDFQSLLLYN